MCQIILVGVGLANFDKFWPKSWISGHIFQNQFLHCDHDSKLAVLSTMNSIDKATFHFTYKSQNEFLSHFFMKRWKKKLSMNRCFSMPFHIFRLSRISNFALFILPYTQSPKTPSLTMCPGDEGVPAVRKWGWVVPPFKP